MQRLFLTLMTAAVVPCAASAQTLREQTRTLNEQTRTLNTDSVSGPSRVLSINPFIVLFGYFAGEYEQRVSSVLSVAVSSSFIKFDNHNFSNLDIKARLYPNEKALQGFGFAPSIGASSINTRSETCTGEINVPCVTTSRTFSAASAAMELHYQWMLGTRKRTAITLGGGLKRFLGSEQKFRSAEVSRFLPTGRATIGYAF